MLFLVACPVLVHDVGAWVDFGGVRVFENTMRAVLDFTADLTVFKPGNGFGGTFV